MRIDHYIDAGVAMQQVQPKLDQLKRTTQQMEAVFMKQLLGEMHKMAPQEDADSGLGADIYQDMFDQALAEGMSKSGSLGIVKLLYQQLAPAVIAQAHTQQLLQVDNSTTENKG
jgi:Rod binding domain-containing protein